MADGSTQNKDSDCSYADVLSARLDAMCTALELGSDRHDQLRGILSRFALPWGARRVGESPAYLSDITDDHTPFEFSLAFREREVDVRLLVETQPKSPRIESRWQAGIDLLSHLERDYPVDTARFAQIANVFAPSDEWARFAIWHAVNAGKKMSFKLYLNPAAHGRHRASATVKAALAQLGMSDVWSSVPRLRRGLDEVKYFSIDLGDERGARVKIYFSHRAAPIDVIESMMHAAPGYQAGAASEFCRALSGGESAFETLPLQTCYAYEAGSDKPTDVALHFPVRAYAANDAESLARVSTLLADDHKAKYARLVRAFAGRELDTCRGVQTYASFWAGRGTRNVTVYLSPQLFGFQPATLAQMNTPFSMQERGNA